jgi:HAD superfamily hydrolase (TIGR01509 family)
MPLNALIWDVDGTLAETERDGHRVAFNEAFATLGLPWRWDVARYGELLGVTGGRERLLHDMASRPDAPADSAECDALARRLHAVKNEAYARIVADGRIALRPGVRELMDECAAAGVTMAIATTTSRSNVEALLGTQLGAAWRERFACVLCAEDAPRKKPDPQVYDLVLRRLAMSGDDVLAIEDSPAGVRACAGAGVPVVVTRSVYFAGGTAESAGGGLALAVGPGLESTAGWLPALPATVAGRVDLAALRHWTELARR